MDRGPDLITKAAAEKQAAYGRRFIEMSLDVRVH
jgi:hypothetical protein